MKEQWKGVPGFEDKYLVSDQGRVKSLRRNIILKPGLSMGYHFVTLPDRKSWKIHQLMAMAFLGHQPNGFESVVDHINSDPLDNRLENLRIISNRKNTSKRRPNKTGFRGVYKKGTGYHARAQIDGRLVYAPTRPTAEEAHKDYLKLIA